MQTASPIILLVQLCIWFGLIRAQSMDELEGTWSSKSNAVFTGPDFYDPVDELIIEPALPGISYSFTSDGYYEEALYRITSNPQDHTCPVAVITFQHGKYELLNNGSLELKPFEVDGRQLVSDPCSDSSESSYNRYSNSELMLKFQVYVDPYHGKHRLDLYQFDGQLLPPLYLAYKPPMMLPTQTMNPTADGSAATASSTSAAQKVRRSLENRYKTTAERRQDPRLPYLWWTGVSLIAVGGFAWLMV